MKIKPLCHHKACWIVLSKTYLFSTNLSFIDNAECAINFSRYYRKSVDFTVLMSFCSSRHFTFLMLFQWAVYGQIDCKLPILIDTNYKDNNMKDNNIYKCRFPFKDSANQSARYQPWCLACGKECSYCFRSVFESSCERHTPDLVTHLVTVNNRIIVCFFHFLI